MREAPDTQPDPPAYAKAAAALKAYVPELVFGGIALVGVSLIVGFDLTVPRFAKVAAIAAAAMAPLGLLTGSKVVGWLHNPQWVYLIDLDARELDGGVYRLPLDDFRELDVLDGDGFLNRSYDLTQLTPNLYVGKSVDLEAGTVVGTWRGTLDDRELATALRHVSECRGQLQADAQRGFILESSAFVVVRRATRNTVESIIETFEEGALPDAGDGIERAIDAELEDFGLDSGDNDLDDLVDDEEIDAMEHKSGFDFQTPEEPPTETPEATADD